MKRILFASLVATSALLFGGQNAQALLIDSFDTTNSPTATATVSGMITTSSTADGVFAATRVLQANALNGVGAVTANAGPSNAGLPPSPVGPFATGYFTFEEDKFANGTGGVSWTRGSGLDLTVGGENGFRAAVSAAQSDNSITFIVTDSSAGVSELKNSIPNTSPFNASLVLAPYALFVATSGGGADFTDITRIEVLIDSPSTSTNNLVGFDFFETAVIPEPSSIALLGMGVFGLMGYGWRRKKKQVAA